MWHCSARVAATDRVLSDGEWAGIARELLDGAGIAAHGDSGGPRWVAIWTEDDATVVPPESGALDGATSFSVQSVCPGLSAGHTEVPRAPAVVAMVAAELGETLPATPDGSVCAGASP